MGWLMMSECRNSTDVRKHLIRSVREQANAELVGHKTTKYGKNFWMAIRYTRPDGSDFTSILLCKIDRDHNDWWGYKDISEEMGPVEDDCPLSLLDLCSEPLNEWSAQWRERVRALAATRSHTYNVGDRCTVYGKEYEVLGKMPGRGRKAYRIRRVSDGRVFKSTPAKMRPVEA